MNQLKKRSQYIDALKGYGILLVVLGHTARWGVNPLENTIVNVVTSFHMPFFIFLSGYVAYNNIHVPRKELLTKKAKTLLIPCVTWIILSFFLAKDNTATFMEYIKYWIVVPSYGWFLWVLFLCFALLVLTEKIQSRLINGLFLRPSL